MKANVLGIRRGIDFAADDGQRICGAKLHISFADEEVDGMAVKALFVPSNIDVSAVEVGKTYDFVYDLSFGRKPRLIGLKLA